MPLIAFLTELYEASEELEEEKRRMERKAQAVKFNKRKRW